MTRVTEIRYVGYAVTDLAAEQNYYHGPVQGPWP